MTNRRLLMWGLAALCGAVMLWQLWPESARSAPSKADRSRKATDSLATSKAADPKPKAASPVEERLAPSSPVSAEKAQVNLNSASLEDLQTLPGIGPALALRIVARRPFESVDDLLQVSGIGPVLMSSVKPHVEL